MKESTKLRLKEDYENAGFIIKDYEKANKYHQTLLAAIFSCFLVFLFLGVFLAAIGHHEQLAKISASCLDTFRNLPSWEAQAYCKTILSAAR